MKNSILYFDTAATMPMERQVVDEMLKHMLADGNFGNPSSEMHNIGRRANQELNSARNSVASTFGCLAKEVIFTSGATESINLAINGLVSAHQDKGRHIISSTIEHKATLECCKNLQSKGFDVSYVTPSKGGFIELESIKKVLSEKTLLVSLMHINNETGVIQPIEEIAEYLSQQGIMFHVDAAQSAGKVAIDMEEMGIDLLSISAHKFAGPKGIGALLIRNRARLKMMPLVFGGGQEFNLRSGTQAVHQIVGLKEALSISSMKASENYSYVSALKQAFIEKITRQIEVYIHGDQSLCSPYIINFSVPGIPSDMLINRLSNEVAIANGSACSSGTIEPSYVLRAMGLSDDKLYGAVRVSFGAYHTIEEINKVADYIADAVKRIKELMD